MAMARAAAVFRGRFHIYKTFDRHIFLNKLSIVFFAT